jgi:excisionase family DNA binding protein
MAELSMTAAAEALGVSVDTVRRRIKRGELVARKVGGAYVVSVESAEAATTTVVTADLTHPEPPAPAEPVVPVVPLTELLRADLTHTQVLLELAQSERRRVEAELATQREDYEARLTAANQESAEMRQLMAMQLEGLRPLLEPAAAQAQLTEGAEPAYAAAQPVHNMPTQNGHEPGSIVRVVEPPRRAPWYRRWLPG